MNKFEIKLTIETTDECDIPSLDEFIRLALKDSMVFEDDKIEILSIIQVRDSD